MRVRENAHGYGSKRLEGLMQRYAEGKDEVFEQLYALMAPRLYQFCLRLAGGKPDADDIFQETFLRLHRARATYLTGANPLYWAFAISRSIHLDRLRYRRRHPEELGLAHQESAHAGLKAGAGYDPEAQVRAHDLADIVTVELQRMSERNRVAYILLREQHLSVKEAAATLGISQDAVKQRAHRACEQLRNALAGEGWELGGGRSPGVSPQARVA